MTCCEGKGLSAREDGAAPSTSNLSPFRSHLTAFTAKEGSRPVSTDLYPSPSETPLLELDTPPATPIRHPSPPTPARYLVCVLYYGAVDREHDRCVKALHGKPYVYDVLEMTGCPYIDMGRSICATGVLDNPAIGGLLFIDHDMVFEPEECAKVIESAEACRGTVGAAYSMRRPGRIIGGIDGSKLEPGKKVVFFEGGEALPAQYLGMGMTAIHRSVFERLVEASEKKYARQQELMAVLDGFAVEAGMYDPNIPCQEFHDVLDELRRDHLQFKDLPRLGTGISEADCVPFFANRQLPTPATPGRDGNYYGEDVSFCIRNHEHGIPVQVDTRSRVYHKGSYCYGIEDVGMQVPYFDRLEVVDTGNTQPEMRPALFSHDAVVQAALEEHYPDGRLPSAAAPAPLPEATSL